MNAQYQLDAKDFDDLSALEDQLADQVAALSAAATPAGVASATVPVCDVIREILPVLSTVESIICKLSFVPGLKQACKVLRLVIDVLEKLCPGN